MSKHLEIIINCGLNNFNKFICGIIFDIAKKLFLQ